MEGRVAITERYEAMPSYDHCVSIVWLFRSMHFIPTEFQSIVIVIAISFIDSTVHRHAKVKAHYSIAGSFLYVAFVWRHFKSFYMNPWSKPPHNSQSNEVSLTKVHNDWTKGQTKECFSFESSSIEDFVSYGLSISRDSEVDETFLPRLHLK